jgi:hypothetical protein
MSGNEPHPELSGGWFTVLQMPHQLATKKRLQQVCAQFALAFNSENSG